MKLVSVDDENCNDYSRIFRIVVEHDGKQWTKTVNCKDFWVQRDKGYVVHSFARAVRELDRDIAFAEHGKDFRNHCRFTSNFWGPLDDSEQSEQREFLAQLSTEIKGLGL